MNLEHQYYNRLKAIIENKDNEFIHWLPIWKMIIRYREMFGATKLYTKLLEFEAILFDLILNKFTQELKNL